MPPFTFLAGQYIDILLKDGQSRSYSIANSPQHTVYRDWEGWQRWRAWMRQASSRFPMHTSLLEGVNNRIKVIKRMAYGFRDSEYFFLKFKAAFPGKTR